MVEMDSMLFLANICSNSGPRNLLPLSCIQRMGLGYLLSQLSSKALATVLDFALSTGITSGMLMSCRTNTFYF